MENDNKYLEPIEFDRPVHVLSSSEATEIKELLHEIMGRLIYLLDQSEILPPDKELDSKLF